MNVVQEHIQQNRHRSNEMHRYIPELKAWVQQHKRNYCDKKGRRACNLVDNLHHVAKPQGSRTPKMDCIGVGAHVRLLKISHTDIVRNANNRGYGCQKKV